MYSKSAQLYDALYTNLKDYPAEAQKLRKYIAQHKRSDKSELLDVACGTGLHLKELKAYYNVEGLDISPELLEIAKVRNPSVTFHQADMTSFTLPKKFDIITCLFSSIGHLENCEKLNQALQNMKAHLNPGGVVIVEPWILPENFILGKIGFEYANEPELKVARMSIGRIENHQSIFDMHFMVATPKGVENFVETFALTLFSREQYENSFKAAGLNFIFEPFGLMGRGLFIGSN